MVREGLIASNNRGKYANKTCDLATCESNNRGQGWWLVANRAYHIILLEVVHEKANFLHIIELFIFVTDAELAGFYHIDLTRRACTLREPIRDWKVGKEIFVVWDLDLSYRIGVSLRDRACKAWYLEISE